MRIDGHYGTKLTRASENPIEDKDIDKLDGPKKADYSYAVKAEKGEIPKDAGLIDYKEELQKPKEEQEETQSKDDSEDASNTSNRLTEEDYKDICNEGISLEKYNLERLDRMLTRIKAQRSIKNENLINQKEKLEERTKEFRKLNNYYGADKELIKKLENANIPVTEANIFKLSNTWDMAKGALDLSEQSFAYLVKMNLKPTVENLYKAKYSATPSARTEISDKEWEDLKEQVKTVIRTSGMEDTQSNIKNGRWLIENQLPVNAKSLWMIEDLNKIQQELTQGMVYERGIEAIAAGYSPESASLSLITHDRVTDVISVFDTVTDNVINKVLENGGNHSQFQINYAALKEGQKLYGDNTEEKGHNKEKKVQVIDDSIKADSLKEFDIKTVTVRRQLEEIRLKLTVESGTRLIKNGFSLETASLTKIIDELKSLEDSYYKSLLKEGNIEINEENTKLIKSSILGIDELKSAPSYILGPAFSQREITTVHNLLEAGRDYKAKLAESAYESLMTSPRADLGDSIKKAFRNVENILTDMNLDTNEANIRAVRILGYNNMEITGESINRIKVYDAQVNHMLKNFHPAAAIEMIREGINPLEMTVPQINQKLDTIKNELGITEDERFSKFLWKLDKNNAISETERNSFLGIYRLLNAVEKTDGAALGAVIKADQEVSMKTLLTALQSKKNKNMDYFIDNTFGTLSQYITKGESIAGQINTAFSNESNVQSETISDDTWEYADYIKQMAADMKDEIEPDNLMGMDLSQLLEMPIETVYEKLSSDPHNTAELEYYSQQLENLEEIVKNKTEVMQIIKANDLPVTVANLFAAKDYLSKENQVFKRLNKIEKENVYEKALANDGNSLFELQDISETLIHGLTNKESMVNSYEKLRNDWNASLNSIIPDSSFTLSDMRLLQGISNGMSFMTQMSYKESYEIPLKVGDNFTNVNVTVLKNSGESGKVNITMDSLEFGKVMALITVKNSEAGIFITSDSRSGYEVLLHGRDNLETLLHNQELKIRQINYGMGNQIKDNGRYSNYNVNRQDNGEEEKVHTNTLYSLAKTVLIHIKELEIT